MEQSAAAIVPAGTYQRSVIEEAEAFTEEHIRPYAGKFEQQGFVPKELIQEMAVRGYLAAPFPKEYGGLGLDAVHYGLLTEVIGKGCNTLRELLTVHTSLVGETILKWGSDEQKSNWLPAIGKGEKIAAFALSEPEVGTDASGVKCQYSRVADSFVVNGTKKWITYGDLADVFLAIATDGQKISAFLIEKNMPGVSTRRITGMLASNASYIAEIQFDNVLVPAGNLLGVEGGGFTYIVNTALDYGRYSVAWAGVALAQEAIEAMVAYSRSRSQFGKKLHHFQLIQGIIGNAVTKTHAARALCLKAGEMRDAGHEDAVIETNIAKYFSSKAAMEITVDGVQVHGANGCSSQYPVERLFREAKILEIIEGTSQVQQEIISQYALKKYYKNRRSS